jgi:hypothetical protein
MGLIEFVEAGVFRLAEASQHGSRIRDRPRHYVANMLVRFLGRERDTAICSKLVEVKHGATQSPSILAHFNHRSRSWFPSRLDPLPIDNDDGTEMSSQK